MAAAPATDPATRQRRRSHHPDPGQQSRRLQSVGGHPPGREPARPPAAHPRNGRRRRLPFQTSVQLAESWSASDKDYDSPSAPTATHAWAAREDDALYLYGKLVQHFDRWLGGRRGSSGRWSVASAIGPDGRSVGASRGCGLPVGPVVSQLTPRVFRRRSSRWPTRSRGSPRGLYLQNPLSLLAGEDPGRRQGRSPVGEFLAHRPRAASTEWTSPTDHRRGEQHSRQRAEGQLARSSTTWTIGPRRRSTGRW